MELYHDSTRVWLPSTDVSLLWLEFYLPLPTLLLAAPPFLKILNGNLFSPEVAGRSVGIGMSLRRCAQEAPGYILHLLVPYIHMVVQTTAAAGCEHHEFSDYLHP